MPSSSHVSKPIPLGASGGVHTSQVSLPDTPQKKASSHKIFHTHISFMCQGLNLRSQKTSQKTRFLQNVTLDISGMCVFFLDSPNTIRHAIVTIQVIRHRPLMADVSKLSSCAWVLASQAREILHRGLVTAGNYKPL